jgi:ribosome biogenesis GTPase
VPSELLTGRVVRQDAKVYHVDVDGRTFLAAPRGKLFETLDAEIKNPVAVGDLVRVDGSTDPASIESVLPRRNSLGRTASSHDPREQVLVANVDQLFIIGAVRQPGFSSNRTDRILAACEWSEIPAVVVLNKIDLAEDEELEALRATYESAGYPVLETAALVGDGVEALRERLAGKVSVFYGPSGAGKSSLLNALQPGLALKVGKVSKYWQAGKHTTTHSRLIQLDEVPGGGWVIDTPGIRVFRLHGVHAGVLRDLFPEFARFQEACRFPDCTHDHEPDCAVFAAVEEALIAPSRYASYVELLDEVGPPVEDDEYVLPPEGDGQGGGED